MHTNQSINQSPIKVKVINTALLVGLTVCLQHMLTSMCYHIYLLLSILVWYLVVKEKLEKYKNKSLVQLINVAEREGRKKTVVEHSTLPDVYSELPDVFLAFVALS